jgi:hypothetical protein
LELPLLTLFFLLSLYLICCLALLMQSAMTEVTTCTVGTISTFENVLATSDLSESSIFTLSFWSTQRTFDEHVTIVSLALHGFSTVWCSPLHLMKFLHERKLRLAILEVTAENVTTSERHHGVSSFATLTNASVALILQLLQLGQWLLLQLQQLR